jgi:VanZ family protein
MTPRRLYQLSAWLCVAMIGVLSLVAPSLRPVTILPHNLEHAAIFALAGFAAGLGYPGRPIRTLAAFVIFAGAVELAQIYVPGRHATLTDFMVDALAACAGVGIAAVVAKLRTPAAGAASARSGQEKSA